jgi:hypothetical protein
LSTKNSLEDTYAPTISPSNYVNFWSSWYHFKYTGYVESFTVPLGVEALYLYMWGAGGYWGGNGAYVEGTLPVKAGQNVTVIVGGAGQHSKGRAFGGGGGGAYAPGGGGRSAIQFDNEDIVTAGGGGGGVNGGHALSYMNGAIQNVSYRGGNYVMATSRSGNDGGGGSISEGGEGVASSSITSSGSKYQGGDSPDTCNNCGAGGGGFFGGGQGFSSGGGGSSYLYNLVTYHMSDVSLIKGVCAGGKSKYYYICAGSCGKPYQNGCVVIELIYVPTLDPTEAPTMTPTVSMPPSLQPSLDPSVSPTQIPTLSMHPTTEPNSLSLSFLSENMLAIVLLSVAGAVFVLIIFLVYIVCLLNRTSSILNRIVVAGFDNNTHGQQRSQMPTALEVEPSSSVIASAPPTTSLSPQDAHKEVRQQQGDQVKEIGCLEMEPSTLEGINQSNL